jgi:hypothetical protein
MPECQYRGKWFRSNKGLKTHITKSHTTNIGVGGNVLNPFTFDPFGKMERQKKEKRDRMHYEILL